MLLSKACVVSGAPRGNLPAGVYHVTTRTAGPIAMFADDDDRLRYCSGLARTVRLPLSVRMFCLMKTHVHLLLETHEANVLQTAMKSLNWGYAMWFNKRHGRSGHLFGRRYWCAQVTTVGHLLGATRYIARNPVAAGLCERAEDWRWSSYRACIGLDDSFEFVDAAPLRDQFGADATSAAAGLRAFVGAA
jgi:REP-associated tyrosine transposase